MSYIVVDVEADGPIPGDYSMISLGAVIVEDGLERTFYGRLKPISNKYIPEALAVSGHTREETISFADPKIVMQQFADWIKLESEGYPVFVSDNNGFDWMFVCWYFHRFIGNNPFGFSSRRLSDMFCGFYKNSKYRWKKHRDNKYPHNHHPVSDAQGNASALLYLRDQGFKL